MIIDFHVHGFADEIAEKAVIALAECGGVPPRTDGTIAGIKESMRNAGVDKSVVLTIATKPSQTIKINNWAALVQDSDIVCFGTIHPHFMQWENELERIKKIGLKGIKFHPDYQRFLVDEPHMIEIYRKCAELGLIIVFHAGLDIGLPEPYHCMPDKLANVQQAVPDAKIVAAHMGGYSFWNEVEEFLVGKDIYFDTSYCLSTMDQTQLKRIIDRHGYEKILFATDSPWSDQKEELKSFAQLGFSENVSHAILGNNAAKLLGLSQK